MEDYNELAKEEERRMELSNLKSNMLLVVSIIILVFSIFSAVGLILNIRQSAEIASKFGYSPSLIMISNTLSIVNTIVSVVVAIIGIEGCKKLNRKNLLVITGYVYLCYSIFSYAISSAVSMVQSKKMLSNVQGYENVQNIVNGAFVIGLVLGFVIVIILPILYVVAASNFKKKVDQFEMKYGIEEDGQE